MTLMRYHLTAKPQILFVSCLAWAMMKTYACEMLINKLYLERVTIRVKPTLLFTAAVVITIVVKQSAFH